LPSHRTALHPVEVVVTFEGTELVVVVVDDAVVDVVVVAPDVVVEVDGDTVDDVVVAPFVVVVVAATPVSGETQPAGGAVAPVCPGMSTVPAHPKSEKVSSLESVDPSAKWATECVWRMNPDASMEIRSVVPVYP